jgi:hypothetical protein
MPGGTDSQFVVANAVCFLASAAAPSLKACGVFYVVGSSFGCVHALDRGKQKELTELCWTLRVCLWMVVASAKAFQGCHFFRLPQQEQHQLCQYSQATC